MAKKNSKKIKEAPSESYNSSGAFLNYYLVLMFSVFPLYFSSQYSHIRHDKLNVFLLLSCVLTIAEIIIGLLLLNERNREGIIPDKKWYQRLTLTDYAFAALILVYIVSTIFSAYPDQCLTGEIGRNNGLFLFILYFFVYIVASRCFAFKEYVFVVLGITAAIVCTLCILNYFYIDPIGILNNYSEKTAKDFTSTIGNKNIMSAFCCVVVPLFLVFWLNHKNTVLRCFYLALTGLGFAAMLCADSESGFLGFAPLMALLLLYYSRSLKKLSGYFIAVSVMLICAKAVRLFSLAMGDKQKGFGAMQKFFIYSDKSYIALAVVAAVAVAFALLARKGDKKLPVAVPIALGALYLAGIAVLVGVFVNYTFVDTTSKLNSVTKLFRFNEKWGTHRGYMWIKAWEIFLGSGFKNAIVGWGPDCFYYAFEPFFTELNDKFGNSSTNCAHNEFLNYLVTVGVFGLAAYLTVMGSAIVRAFRKAKENYLALAFIAPVVCYLFQSTVNIATPIVTPLVFIFLGLAESVCRQKES
ncbi:MAG: O-antigen ligase family protein [Ruminococcus sp.]|nr:O-antigen ligase family protein [Ruminococcus sp.]